MGSLRHFGPDDLPEPPSIREAFRFAHSEETGCFATAHFGAVATNRNVEGVSRRLSKSQAAESWVPTSLANLTRQIAMTPTIVF
jgi:hypothetical protein